MPPPPANAAKAPSRVYRWAALVVLASCRPHASDAFSSPPRLPSPTFSRRGLPPPSCQDHRRRSVAVRSSASDVENASSPSSKADDLRSLGEGIILEAALAAGATASMIDVEWKSDRIVVTVDVHADEDYVDDGDELSLMMGDYLDEDLLDEGIEFDDDEDFDLEEDEEFDDDDFVEEDFVEDESSKGPIDLTLIARNINDLLAKDGEDSAAFQIAKLHEIEVTTPVFDNVLRGRQMFESYRGFDVTVEHWEEPKKKKKKKTNGKAGKEADASAAEEEEKVEPKLKKTEGKLVERDYDKGTTNVNVKGRIVRIKNDKIESVRLPAAKREKGAK